MGFHVRPAREAARSRIGSGRNGDPNYRTLAEARAKAAEARKLLAEGKDPIAEWNKPDAEAVPTFGEMADNYVEAHKGSWRNEKHAAQWTMTLTPIARRSASFLSTGSIPKPSFRS